MHVYSDGCTCRDCKGARKRARSKAQGSITGQWWKKAKHRTYAWRPK